MCTVAMGMGSPTEIAIIAGVVLLLFGGSRIAGLGRSLGEGVKGFKDAVAEEEEAPPAVGRQ